MSDTYLHERETVPYFMWYTKEYLSPRDSSCYKRNLGIIEENKAHEKQSENKPHTNILQSHCNPLYVRKRKIKF